MSEILSDDERFAAIEEGTRYWQRGQHMVRGTMMSPSDDIDYCKALAVERAVVEKLAAMGGELPAFDVMLREAEKQVRASPLWKRFIDGTPLSNDIAVWMTVLAQEYARAHYARGIAAGMAQERARATQRAEALAEGILNEVDEPPDANCSCHISPPCNDCFENSCLRELFALARDTLAAPEKAQTR